MLLVYIVHFTCFLMEWLCTQAEMFSAADYEKLLNMQARLKDDLENYIRNSVKQITFLNEQLEIYKQEHKRAMEDIQSFTKNPINNYLLIKRLTIDVDDILHRIRIGIDNGRDFEMRYKYETYHIPTNKDLEEAANTLSRLQTIYKLDVKELAKGILDGDQNHSSPMTAGDCFEMGRILYDKENYENTIPWMMEALRKYQQREDNAYPFTKVDIFEFISVSYYYLDDVQSAATWSQKILDLEPTNSHAHKNLKFYQDLINKNGEKYVSRTQGVIKEAEEPYDHFENYSSSCRGEKKIFQEPAKSLVCYYLTDKHPFLLLARAKVEQLSVHPDVFLFYDVLTDNESEVLQNMAKQKLHRSLTKEDDPGESRISVQAWLRDEDSGVVATVSRKVSHITGFSMATAEPLQVVCYSVGGHYEPHYDFLDNPKIFAGNRLATVLFYISEVAQGGATVFLKPGLRVFPVKNAALFWMNLDSIGELDYSTLHAGCLVLRGDKWIATKWIREFGQEFISPCLKK